MTKDLVENHKGLSDVHAAWMFPGRSGEVLKSLCGDADTVYINQDCAKMYEHTGLNPDLQEEHNFIICKLSE